MVVLLWILIAVMSYFPCEDGSKFWDQNASNFSKKVNPPSKSYRIFVDKRSKLKPTPTEWKGKAVMIKFMPFYSEKKETQSRTEITILRALADTNATARMLTCVEGEKYLAAIIERLGPNLLESARSYTKWPLSKIINICLQAARALYEIHKHGIYHDDIKLTNFVFTDQNLKEIRLIDFSNSGIGDPQMFKGNIPEGMKLLSDEEKKMAFSTDTFKLLSLCKRIAICQELEDNGEMTYLQFYGVDIIGEELKVLKKAINAHLDFFRDKFEIWFDELLKPDPDVQISTNEVVQKLKELSNEVEEAEERLRKREFSK